MTSFSLTFRQTYYWNIGNNDWKSGPNLNNARSDHAAGIVIDRGTNTQIVAVVGGNSGGEYLDSVELLLEGQNEWIQGTIS